jgi:heme exporter protein D
MLYNWLEFAALCVFVSVVAVVAIVVASEWSRERREREIYRQTRRRKS